MKLLHISTDYCWTKVYPNIVRSLSNTGIDQIVYVPMRNASEEGLNRVEGVEFVYSFILKIWMKAFYFVKIKTMCEDIARKINVEQIDIIHSHFLFTDGGTAYLLKKRFGTKYITTIRNTDVNIYFKYFLHTRKFGLNILLNSEAIIFLSSAYRDFVFSKYVPAHLKSQLMNKSKVVPNGIDNFWLSHAATLPKKINGEINFIFVGELSKNKNIHKTIKILKKLNQTVPCYLTIIGRPSDYTKQVLALVEENPFVTYLGEVNDKELLCKHFQESSIYIMPSKYETFGLTYIEAMSQGLPCIYSRGQGIDGYFEEGKVGCAIDPDNIDDSIKRIVGMLDRYEDISQNCIEVVKDFEWSKVVSEYSKIYKKIND